MAAHRTLLVLRGAISAAVLAGLGATVASADAIPVVGSDVFQTTYFDVGTSSSASRAGYGGPGFTGGAGENVVRIVNPTSANGTLCAMVYVFDDFEEMQTCCGCPVTPDGLRTLSVLNDLTFSPAANNSNLTAGVIEVVSSTANWTPGTPPPAPNPMGTNGPGSGTIANGCSPTGIASNDPYHRATAVSPIPALRAWITHDELVEPGNIPGGRGVQGVSMDPFNDAPLDSTHLSALQIRCAFLIRNGSGAGICTCGAGEDSVAIGSNRPHN